MKPSQLIKSAAVAATATVFLAGCQSVPLVGSQGNVGIVDSQSRAHITTDLTGGDYLALAETVTNKMLSSRFVQSWGSKQPRLIVGVLVNNTDDESIRMTDVHDRIQETILNSGLVRVVDKSATSFDYIIKSELTSTRQYGQGGKELVYYTLQLKMFTIMGELKGQWSDDLAMAKGGRGIF
jgi:hypothetical protein